jgi:hypothetical protein
MTAYLVIARGDGAHIVSDGAGIARDGTLSEITSKTVLFPSFGVALAVTGVCGADWLEEDVAASGVADLDQLLSALPTIAHGIRGRNVAIQEDFPDVSLTMIAWCPKRGASAWQSSTGIIAAARMQKTYDYVRLAASLEDITDPGAVLGRPMDVADVFDPSRFDVARDGLALMMDCRTRPADPAAWGGRTDQYVIGGTVELTTCGPQGVTRRILHRWHEDRIGKRIQPTKG